MLHEETVAPRRSREAARAAPLLDLDPDLGQFLPAEALAGARRELMVRVVGARRGPLPLGRDSAAAADPRHLGLLLVDGLVARELLADDVASLELLGPGDVLRPWQLLGDGDLLRAEVRWSVLADARLAIVDQRVAATLARYPEIYSMMIERLTARAQRLAVTQAICQLNRVDRRLLTLLWHLAGRWGRVTPRGTLVPLCLSHRMLAQLVGARRPTVSTAFGELARRGEVARNPDGTWLLTGEPVGAPDPGVTDRVPPRRRLIPSTTPAAAPGPDSGPDARLDPSTTPDPIAMLAELGRLRDAGVLGQDEFADKKAELLARV